MARALGYPEGSLFLNKVVCEMDDCPGKWYLTKLDS